MSDDRRWEWTSGWVLDADDGDPQQGHLVLSGGFDRVVDLHGLSTDQVAQLQRWIDGAPIDLADDLDGNLDSTAYPDGTTNDSSSAVTSFRDETDASATPHEAGAPHLVAQLAALGAIAPATGRSSATGRSGAANIDVIADEAARSLRGPLVDKVTRIIEQPESSSQTPVVIALRASAERVAVPRDTDVAVLHVDLRNQHTLVVGPFELAGITACDSCYDTRLARRWPTPALPSRPGVLDYADLIIDMVAFHVGRCIATGNHLINQTIAHSFVDGTAMIDPLLMVPGCAGCGPRRPATGRVRLPWVSSEVRDV